MNKAPVRQIVTLVLTLAVVAFNMLAVLLPLNGLDTGYISDHYFAGAYFVPAGFIFSIWGLIYIGLIAFGIYQLLPSQRSNSRLQAAFLPFTISAFANMLWLVLWHTLQFVWTVPVMLVLLGSLIWTYLRLGTGRSPASPAETWAVRVPFSIYLGWITVATTANISDLLYLYSNQGILLGIAPQVWMGIVLAAVVLIAGLVSFTRRDLAYSLVLLWALYGITVKQAAIPAVAGATWIALALVAVMAIAAQFIRRPSPAPARKR